MRRILGLARTGVSSVLLHPLRSAATVACTVAALAPWLAGAGVARGLLDQADLSLRLGADLYLSGQRFGRPAPVPLGVADAVRSIPGVRDVTARIVGEIPLGRERVLAVVVGLPRERLPAEARCVRGRLFEGGASREVVVGAELARRLALEPGSRIPPFYRNAAGERIVKVSGVFESGLPIWESNLLFCSFETASEIFDQSGLATEILVECEPGYRRAVEEELLRSPDLPGRDGGGALSLSVRSRADLEALLPAALRHMEGVFNLHFLLAFAVGIPLLMVVSGVGLAERRAEAALLKAMGWTTDQVMFRAFVESLLLSLLGASVAILVAWGWLDLLHGRGVAGIFLPGAEAAPAFPVPFRLRGANALAAFTLSLSVVGVGSLAATWRASAAPPALALR
jgi:hypothetical protein